jgi:transposase
MGFPQSSRSGSCGKKGLFGLRSTTVACNSNASEQASRGYEFPTRITRRYASSAGEVFRQIFGRGMRLVSKTNTQIPSGPRLYYKAFAETESCLFCNVCFQKGTPMSNSTTPAQPTTPVYAARIGLDWADQKHVYTLLTAEGHRSRGELEQSPEAVEQWAAELAARFPGQSVAVALEQSRGALVTLLVKYAHLHLYPVAPQSLAYYRKSVYPSGAKSDPRDADLILEYLVKHPERVELLELDDELTRSLQFLVEQRRELVDRNTAETQALTQWLKLVFPQVLGWFDSPNSTLVGDLLLRWPTLGQLQKAGAKTLRTFWNAHHSRGEQRLEKLLEQIQAAVPATQDPALLAAAVPAMQTAVRVLEVRRTAIAELDATIAALYHKHPDRHIMESLPGAGDALEPRLIAAVGTLRHRFACAADLACAVGIAPVTERSGSSDWVHFRWSCPKFPRQTFHEWAGCSLPHCPWAREHYHRMRAKGLDHHAAVRSVAFKWVRIFYVCWRDGVPYSESTYLAARQRTSRPTNLLENVEWKTCGGFKKLVCKSPQLPLDRPPQNI